ncbi:MAG: O-antigen ligase family protein [Desulfobulbaceae bacterium]|nr:O-antigen ligase family protein [Desulfobulbaceae bacterium]
MYKKTGIRDNYYANIFGLQLGVILIGSLIVKIIFKEQTNIYNIFQFISVVWPFLFFKSIDKWFRLFIKSKYLFALAIFYSISVISSIESYNPFLSLMHVHLLLLILFQMYIYSSSIDFYNLRYIHIYLAFGLFFCVLLAINEEQTISGRLGGLLNPNSIGMLMSSLMLCCFIIKRNVIKFVLLAIFLYFLIETGSRSSVLSFIAGVMIINFSRLKITINFLKVSLISFCIVLLIIISLLYGEYLWKYLLDFFAVDSKYRGLDSGATGRVFAWQEAWRLFLNNPFFGVGFRAHEYHMTTQSSAHNGYLSLLAEVGIFGSLVIFAMISISIYKLSKYRGSMIKMFMLGCIIAYLVIAIFERYMLNIGNSFSLIFIFFVYSQLVNGDEIGIRIQAK